MALGFVREQLRRGSESDKHIPGLDGKADLLVRENKARFVYSKDPNAHTTGFRFVLTGGGSVLDDLFSRADICTQPIPDFLNVADYIISFMW